MNNKVLKKVLSIVGDVFLVLFIGLMLFISITNIRAKQSNGLPNVFGTGYLNVLTESMDDGSKDAIKVGDMVVVEVINSKNATKLEHLNVGDIITYHAFEDVNGDGVKEDVIISHRIVEEPSTLPNGNINFVVKGDNPLATERTNVQSGAVLGIYKRKISGMGKVFNWLSHGWGFFIVIVGPCIAFLVYEVFKFVKALGEYNHERFQELDEEADTEKKIAMRQEVLAGLVKDGTLTQEQADEKLAEFKASLEPKQEKEEAIDVEDKKEEETK